MIFSKPGVLKVKAAEEMGCFHVFIAFAELKTAPVSVASVKKQGSVLHQTGLGTRLFFSDFQSTTVLAV